MRGFSSLSLLIAPVVGGVLGFAAEAEIGVRASEYPQPSVVAACSPLDSVTVQSLYVTLTSSTQHLIVEVTVDGELRGTERLEFVSSVEVPARVEVLRFHPAERLQLLQLSSEGRRVLFHGTGLAPGGVVIDEARHSAERSPRHDAVTIARSTWREALAHPGTANQSRRAMASQTYAQCRGDCVAAHWQCENDMCWYPDPQCLWWCENEFNWCESQCPCDGFDPILVDEYTVETTIAVSGRLAVICAGNIFSLSNKTYYDVYDFVDRTETYRVWEDCHGDRTTELVSTVDSAVYRCHVYTGQICSSSPGTPPFCVIG